MKYIQYYRRMENKSPILPIIFSYKGASHAIEINTLISSQMHFLNILNEVSRLTNSNVKLRIKIEAIQPGSFEINQLIEIVAVSGLFTSPSIAYIGELFSIITDYISIKEFLSGSKAEKVIKNDGSINIYLNGNNIKVAPNAFTIYKNSYSVHNSVIKLGDTLESDEDVDGILLTDQNVKKNLLDVPREKFSQLGDPNGYLSEETREELDDATLIITKPELNPKKRSKWNFIYKGRKINQVTITDEDFLSSVSQGLRFGNGDALRVDLKIVYKYDPIYEVFVEKSFEVLTVKDTIFKGQQTSI